MRHALALAALMLAGCAGAGSGEDGTSASPLTSDAMVPGGPACVDLHGRTVPPANGTCPPGPAPVVEPIDHDGQLGLQASVCHDLLPECQAQALSPDTCEVRIEHPGWTLRAGNITATWTADTPATQELTLDVMVMNKTVYDMLGTVTGPSPLTVSFAGLERALAAGDVVHFYAYNHKGFTPLPGGGAFATTDQAVHLGGNVTFLPPPATR